MDLDALFRDMLGRPVDQSGWAAYKDMDEPSVRKILRDSSEYQQGTLRKENTKKYRELCRDVFESDVKCGVCDEQFTMIVCRFQEDCSWLLDLLGVFPRSQLMLYNRGPELSTTFREHSRVHIIEDSNDGNEEVAYLRYILDNYDDLPDNIVFFQPDIDHNPSIITDIQYGSFPLARCMGYSETMCGIGVPDISNVPSLVSDPLPHGPGQDTRDEFIRACGLSKLPSRFANAGCFRVTKQEVQHTPRRIYYTILQMLVGYFVIEGRVKYKAYGSIMERCWTGLFFD